MANERHSLSPAGLLLLVIAYNRPQALSRLLESLSKLDPTDAPVDLLISIDGGGDPQCLHLARQFHWAHGNLRIQAHSQNLGLKTHVENAIDNVVDYDAVIVLEDDISVSPRMFHYCQTSMAIYGSDPTIAQISLYAPDHNEFCGLPFIPVRDDGDAWFSQVPASWGQMWSRDQWIRYRNWQRDGNEGKHFALLPESARRWGSQSWKKSYFEYVVSSHSWVVYPYTSLSTNHGDAGIHHRYATSDLNVALETRTRDYRFLPFSSDRVRYDAWLEPSSDIANTHDLDPTLISVDLYGIKPLIAIKTPYLLSRKPCGNPIKSYGSILTPLELNVRLNVPGLGKDSIFLGRTTDFLDSPILPELFAAQVKRRLRKYLYDLGYAQGQADLRAELRYQLGNAIMVLPSKIAAVYRSAARYKTKYPQP